MEEQGESTISADGAALAGQGRPALHGWQVLAVIAFGATMLGIGLDGSVRALTFHETHFAQPAREMIDSGDWVLMTYGQAPYKHKPPLTHWMIAVAMALTGSEAEWVARLPIVLAAIGVALIVGRMAGRWLGPDVGFLTALVQLTPYYMLMQARLAEADMVLCLAVSGAMALFAQAFIREPGTKPPRWQVWAFYVLAGLALMTKGPVGLMFIVAGCALYILVQRDGAALRGLISPVGWLAFALVALPWWIAVFARAPEVFQGWLYDNVDRFGGKLEFGRKPFYYYLYMVPALLLPWTFWAVPAAVGVVRAGLWKQRHWRFCLCWFAAGMTVLSISSFKHKHYAIPALPPLSVLVGWVLHRWAGRKGQATMPTWLAMLGTVLVVVGCTAALWIRWPALAPGGTAVVVGGGLFVVGATAAHKKRWRTVTLACLFGMMWYGAVASQLLLMPHFDSYRSGAEFARRVGPQAPAGETIHVVYHKAAQEIYYLPLPVAWHESLSEFTDKAQARPGVYHVVLPAEDEPELAKLGTVREKDRFKPAGLDRRPRAYVVLDTRRPD